MTVGGSFSVRTLTCPDVSEVLDCLGDHDMVHFACHGMSDIVDPSESCLILQKRGQPDSGPVPDLLTVRQISEVQLRKLRIAFLSACSTAENKVMRLADEVIHLASGFQVAGIAHVIGSMWSSSDKICVDIAEEFYKQLTIRPWNETSNRDVALALHKSILNVRSLRRNRARPLLWAQYIHLGA
jgi:CHAT domain-containing protein